jgi:allantoinase
MTSIRSNRVVFNGTVGPATVHIEGGRIARIDNAEAARDYGDLVIMPGVVDSHVHVNEPGRTEWEGFETATRAAAAGGITTIVDMPLNSIPPTTTVGALHAKAEAMRGKLHVDVGLWGGVVPGNLDQLLPMLEAGARGFKCFLVHSGVDEFPNISEDELWAAARTLAPTGAPLLVHAELPQHIRQPAGDPEAYDTYLQTRPKVAEDEAIDLLLRVSNETGAHIHVVHLSSANSVDTVHRGVTLTAETTPHYLHLEAERIPPGRCEFKCAPPIREHENRERLWRGVFDGDIGVIVSDHSPCAPHLKGNDFVKAWGGIASVQFVLPLVWTEASQRGHSIAEIARWICEGPASIARLRKKGRIVPDNDADFVIWSPEEEFVVEPAIIEHRHKVTPYIGETLRGVVKETWLRGEPVDFNSRRGEWQR